MIQVGGLGKKRKRSRRRRRIREGESVKIKGSGRVSRERINSEVRRRIDRRR